MKNKTSTPEIPTTNPEWEKLRPRMIFEGLGEPFRQETAKEYFARLNVDPNTREYLPKYFADTVHK